VFLTICGADSLSSSYALTFSRPALSASSFFVRLLRGFRVTPDVFLVSDKSWKPSIARLANLIALWKTDRPNTALEAPKCECAAEQQANSASRVHDALDSHRKLCDVLQRDINRPSANASGL